MAHLDGAYEQIAERLTGIDRRLDSFEHKMEARFTQIVGIHHARRSSAPIGPTRRAQS